MGRSGNQTQEDQNSQNSARPYRVKGASKNRRERQKCKAHGAQEPEHIFEYVRIPSTAQRSSFDAQQVFRGALKAFFSLGHFYAYISCALSPLPLAGKGITGAS
jgi:hypothetical protein